MKCIYIYIGLSIKNRKEVAVQNAAPKNYPSTFNTPRMKLHKDMFTHKSLTRWGKLLYCSDLGIVKQTLKATT